MSDLTNLVIWGTSCPKFIELAADVHEDAKCWVTTFVVWAGTKRSSDGLFRLVPKVEWEHLGPTAFCRQQRQLAHIWITKHPET